MSGLNPTALEARARAIRLVLTDLDETLVGPSNQIGTRSRRAIAQLQKAGVTVAVCTGRGRQSALPVVEELGVRYAICNNGACVYDGDQLIAEERIPADVTEGLLEFFYGYDLPALVVTQEGYHLSYQTPETARAERLRRFAVPVWARSDWAQPSYKVHVPGSAHLFDECKARFGTVAHVIYHPRYLEVAPFGVNKQVGAQVLADLLGVEPSQVAAVGDGQNDLEMVRWAGIGCAMGNADPLLKAEADWLLPPNDQDGTALLFELIAGAMVSR
jgi:Cof subfamily protein (haloacid dehalogenase superfamily)